MEPAEELIVTKSDIDDLLLETTHEIPEKINKQGKSSIEKVTKTNLKKKDIVPATTDINRVLNEKQLNFLHYRKNNTEKNRPTSVLGSSTSIDQLAAIGSEKINVPGDGNCFFRAISHQLYRRQNDHLKIRTKAVEYLKSNMNHFAPFIDKGENLTVQDKYIKQMGQDGIYADHLAILATAIIIDKNIIVHEIGRKPLRIPGSDCFDNQLHVWYNSNSEHYYSVVTIDGNSLILSPEQILET
jgi:hypothetical protein